MATLSAPTSIISVQTLGSFSVRHFGRVVLLPRLKDRALLAYLAINIKEIHRREYLADLLWQRCSEKNARHSLNQSIYTVRRLLPDLLITDKKTLRCDPTRIKSDALEILNSIARGDALSCIEPLQGEFLADIDVKDSSEFEEWRSDFGRQLNYQFEYALKNQMSTLPLDEQLRLMTTVPRRFVSALVARGNGVAIEPIEPAQTAYPVPIKDVPSSGTLPLVGRSRQLAVLTRLFETSAAMAATFAVVSGPAGYGKTRLVNDFLDSIPSGCARILRVRSFETERLVGFGPIVDILARRLHRSDFDGLEPIWLAVLSELVPNLQAIANGPPALSAAAAQTRLFEAVLQVVLHLSRQQPLILFVDDIQWADRSSRALLSYVSHRLAEAHVMLIVTTRAPTSQNVLPAPFDEWQQISLAKLDASDIGCILECLQSFNSAEPPTVDQLVRLTGGAPYLINGVLKSWISSGEVSEQGWSENGNEPYDVVGPVLERLAKAPREMLSILAVVGRPASMKLLSRMVNGASISKTIRYLIRHDLIISSGGKVAFHHDLIREAVYDRLPLFLRTELHCRAAEMLRRSRSRAGEVAEHYYKARVRRLAYRYALIAAQDADTRHATEESISFLRLAIKASRNPAAHLRLTLASHLMSIYRLSEGRRVVKDLRKQRNASHLEMLRAQLVDLEAAYTLGQVAGPTVRRRLVSIQQTIDPRELGLLIHALRLNARSAFHDADANAISSSIRVLRDFARDNATAEGIEALAHAARVHSLVNSASEAEEWVAPVWNAVESFENHELKVRLRLLSAVITYEVGKLVLAEQLHRKLLADVEESGAISQYPVAAVHLHMMLIEQGKYDEAKDLSAQIRRRIPEIETVYACAPLAANDGCMYYEVGDLHRAEIMASAALAYSARMKAVWIEIGGIAIKGLVAFDQGRLAEARDAATAGKRIISNFGHRAADVSHLETLIYRVDSVCVDRESALQRLRDAVGEYHDRDVVCRLRMQLELARALKAIDRHAARREAKLVFEQATAINARPIAERADSLLLRL
ncbi:MAG: AAA family ATPase [Gemmatimonadota bacterium]